MLMELKAAVLIAFGLGAAALVIRFSVIDDLQVFEHSGARWSASSASNAAMRSAV